MNEQGTRDASTDPNAVTAKPRRRGRRVLVVLAAVLALLAAVAALAPTFVSWGLFRGSILSAVGERVNGTVSLGSLQVGWSGPIVLDGLVIDHQDAGTKISVSATVGQGLWTLLTKGIDRVDLAVSGSVRTRREPDGTLGIARLAKPDPSAPSAAPAAPAAPSKPGLPAGMRSLALAIGPLDIEILNPDGSTETAVRGLAGTVAATAGGDASVKLSGKSEYRGTGGSFDLSASFPGLLAADGSLELAASGADLSLRAKDLAFDAGGMTLRVPDATVTMRAKALTGRVDVAVDAAVACDGEAPASVKADVAVDRLLAADGAFVVDLSAIHGTVAVKDLPTRPFERFAAGALRNADGSPAVVLARDIGRTVALEARFADASGGDLSIALRSDAVTLSAAGSIDPATRAASFRTVEAGATIAPPVLAALGLQVSAPSRLELRATDVSIPAAAADGSFPIDALRASAEVSLSLAGLRVPGPDGPVALDVRDIRGTLRATPVGAGVEGSVDVAGSDPKAAPSRLAFRVRRGGPYGANGSLTAAAIPTSLVSPFLPRSVPLDLGRDLGSSVTRLELSLSDASPAAFAVKLESQFAKVDLRGTVAADGALALSGPGSVDLAPARRGLLAAFGAEADADLSVGVTIRRLELPPTAAFSVSRIAADLDFGARPFAQPPVGFRLGTGDGARTVRIRELRATVTTPAVGTQVDATVLVRSDLADLDATVGAKSLGDLSKDAIERAALAIDLKATRIPSVRLESEVPALKGVATELGGASWDLGLAYRGSLLEGEGTVELRSGTTLAKAKATLSKAALVADATVAAELKAGKPLASLIGDAGIELASPARVDVTVPPVRLARTVPWDFAAPESAKLSVRSPKVAVAQVPGLAGGVALESLALEAEVAVPATGAPSARGTLSAAAFASRPGAPAARLAALRSSFDWSGAAAKAPMAWKVDAALDEITAAGVAALVDLDDAARAEIGDGARLALRASSLPPDGASFEVDSTLKRMAAHLKGEWLGGELRLADSSVDVSLPAAQSTAIVNSVFPALERPNGRKEPAWKSVEPVAVRATIQSLRMKPGSSPAAAVLRAEVRPFAMTSAGGERVVVDALSASVDAPSADRPATVSAQVALAGAGTAKAAATLDAKVSSWLAADGSFNADAVRIDGGVSCQQASTRVLDALLGLGTELQDAFGPDLTVSLKAVSKGPGLASGSLSCGSRFINFDAPQVVLRRGMVSLGADKPVVLDFVPSPPVRSRYLTRVNPILGSLSVAPGKQPFRLTVSALGYPLDGNLAKFSADFRIDIGEVLVERGRDNPLLDQISVFAEQAKVPKSVEALVEPLVVTVRKGQLSYKDFFVRLERQGAGWKTTLKSTGSVDLVQKPPFARAITVSYPVGCLAKEGAAAIPVKKVGGAVTNALSILSLGLGQGTMLRLTVSGPLGEVNGKPAEMQEEWDVEFDGKESEKAFDRAMDAVGKTIQQGLQDLIGGGKQPKGGK